MKTQTAYTLGRAAGRHDYRHGRNFTPEIREAAEGRQGYCDGWEDAAEETTAKYGHAFACALSWEDGGVAAYEARRQSA